LSASAPGLCAVHLCVCVYTFTIAFHCLCKLILPCHWLDVSCDCSVPRPSQTFRFLAAENIGVKWNISQFLWQYNTVAGRTAQAHVNGRVKFTTGEHVRDSKTPQGSPQTFSCILRSMFQFRLGMRHGPTHRTGQRSTADMRKRHSHLSHQTNLAHFGNELL
jgi:hypothetical protein